MEHDGRILPRGALVRYREWYGASKPNVGLKLPPKRSRAASSHAKPEQRPPRGHRLRCARSYRLRGYRGPSIAETMGVTACISAAPTTPVSPATSAWAAGPTARAAEGQRRRPCDDLLSRSLPRSDPDAADGAARQHNIEDLDTDGEDHAVDSARYGCMSRPYLAHEQVEGVEEDRNRLT